MRRRNRLQDPADALPASCEKILGGLFRGIATGAQLAYVQRIKETQVGAG